MDSTLSERPVRPWVAVLLTFACTGLGHVYAGRERRGLVCFLLTLLFVPAAVLATLLPPSRFALALLVVSVLLSVGTALVAVVDALRTAREARSWPVERRLWRPGLVALFLVVGLAFPLGGAILVRTYGVETFRIASASMEPSLRGGDRILVDKRAFLVGAPRRGDIVVFRSEGGLVFVKRVLGLPSERFRITGGVVHVNDRPIPQSPAPEGTVREAAGGRAWLVHAAPTPDVPEVRIPDDAVYLLGDNRGLSRDSRLLGPVPLDDLIGPATYVIAPSDGWARWGPVR
jgi:signal peptidase I